MKVAHVCIVTPKRCGLYETARELVVGLRMLGVDSRLIDIPSSNKVYPQGYPQRWDRKAPVANMDWALDADVIVNHSGYDGTPIAETDQPIIHVAHGRPYSGFLTERRKGTPIYSYHYRQNSDSRWESVVTFWPEHIPYLKVMFPDKPVRYVPPPVDLDYWTPEEKPQTDTINLVCTDPWREDVDPFLPLNAVALYGRGRKVKFHLYGVPKDKRGAGPIIRRMQDDGTMGEIKGWHKDLRSVYRKADALVTGNTIATRAVREAMACGCPVAVIGTNLSTHAVTLDKALSADRAEIRRLAEKRFNLRTTAAEFHTALEATAEAA